MRPQLSSDLRAELQAIDSCSLSNAIETFQVRLRNQGFCDSRVRPLFPIAAPSLGFAATCQFRTTGPPPKNHRYFDRTDWWNYVKSVPAPSVVVLQDVDERPAHGAVIGEVHLSILRALDVRAVITNGAVRDLDAIEALGFPVFAGGTSVSHSYAHILQFGIPVEIGGLTVNPGDLLHADRHGVLNVPLALAPHLPARVAEARMHEQRVIEFCRSPQFSLQKLEGVIECLG